MRVLRSGRTASETRGAFRSTAQTGDLTVADVGQNAWEEIDFVPAAAGRGRGVNFGWGCWEGRHTYTVRTQAFRSAARLRRRPRRCTSTRTHVAVRSRGGYVVRDPTVPQLVGRYVYGDYCTSPVWSIALQIPDGAGRHGHRPRPREHVLVRRGRLRSRLHRFRWRRGSAAPDRRCGATRGVRSFGASDAAPTASRWASSTSHRLRLSRQRSVACLGSSACASSPHGRGFDGRDAGSDGSDASTPSAGGASSSRSHLARPAGGSAGRVSTSR